MDLSSSSSSTSRASFMSTGRSICVRDVSRIMLAVSRAAFLALYRPESSLSRLTSTFLLLEEIIPQKCT